MKQFSTQTRFNFQKSVIPPLPDTVLDEAVEWIKNNLLPEDVFPTTDLVDWAAANGYKRFE